MREKFYFKFTLFTCEHPSCLDKILWTVWVITWRILLCITMRCRIV